MATGLNLGLAAGTDIPVEHLDYGYVGECRNAKEVEKILQILRSGKEGLYPDLVAFTERRLSEMDPSSQLLVEEGRKKKVTDLPGVEQQEMQNDMESWSQTMREEESSLSSSASLNHCKGERDREREREILMGLGLPPIRKAGTIADSKSSSKNPTSVKSKTPSQRIKSGDFRAWDQFDADAAADHVDRQAEREEEEERKGRCNGVAKKISVPVELSESERDMTDIERNKLAIHEKEKGNESFRSGDYEEAVVYYSHSLLLRPSTAAYNNRALMYIKLERHSVAIEDCMKVLDEDPNNVKALFRLATAKSSLKQDDEAMADFERLLQLDPSNKKAQDQLRILRARREARGPAGEKLLKKNRLHIVEVEGCGKGREEGEERGEKSLSIEEMKRLMELKQKMDDFSAEIKAKKAADARREKSRSNSKRSGGPSGGKLPGKMAADDSTSVGQDLSSRDSDLPSPPVQTTPTPTQATPTPAQATHPVAQVPLPPAVQQLKEEGNKLFRSGQYAEASEKYNKAVSQLEQGNEGGQHSVSLATLLTNRAACSLKTGQCNSCVSDCSRSISLLPLNHKAVLRRARAYEMKEKFQEAYMDYHLSLRLDSTVPQAQDAVTRLGRHLQDEYGLDWRVRLPSHPDTDLVLGALRAAQSQHHTTPIDAVQTQLTQSEEQNQHNVTPVDAVQTQSMQSVDQNQHNVTPVEAVQTQLTQSVDQNQHDVTPVEAVQTQLTQCDQTQQKTSVDLQPVCEDSSEETPVTPEDAVGAGVTPIDASVIPTETPSETAVDTTRDETAETPTDATDATDSPNKTPADANETPADSTETPADANVTPADSTETPADTNETPVDATEAPADANETPADATETPADSTETPADATETPADSTETPADSTETPVDATETPVDSTEAPTETSVDATETPADATETPVDSTETPADSTETPVDATETPVDSTEAPTETPVDATETPVDATETPADSTETPADSTETPADSTETPVDATETPADSTETPADSTETPVDATETPADSTEAPTDSTQTPVDSTETSADATETPANTTPQTPADETQEEPVDYEKMYEEYKSKGNRHVKKDEFKEAVEYYTECIEIFPDRAAAYNNRAFCHLKMKNPEGAEGDCSRALELEPDNIKALYRRGVARKERGLYKEAMKDLRRLVSLDSSNAAGNKELESVKQLWEKQLRTLQTKPNRTGTKTEHQRTKTDHQRTKKVPPSPTTARGPTSTRGQVNTGGQATTKSYAPRGKNKGSSSKSRGPGKNSPPGESAKSAAASPSSVGQSSSKDSAEKVTPQVNKRTSAVESLLGGGERGRGEGGGGAQGDGFITANSTTYYKKNGESKERKKRTKIEIVEVDVSSEEDEEREKEEEEERGSGGCVEVEREREETEGGEAVAEEDAKKGRKEEEGSKEEEKEVKVEKEGSSINGATNDLAAEEVRPNCTSGEREKKETDKMLDSRPMSPSTEPDLSSSDSPPSTTTLTSYEFVQRWNGIPRSARSGDYARLLQLIPLRQLPDIITNKLDGTMLTHILEAITDYFIPRGMYKFTTELLYNLSQVQRFSVVSMFLSRSEKQALSKVLDTLNSQDAVKLAPEMLEHIKASYGI